MSIQSIEAAHAKHPKAKGLIALHPTYFGVVADFTAIADLCRQKKLILVADEAHGPHFRFGEDYPIAAEAAGADLTIQSTHKILSGLSQSAVLHLRGPRVEHARVRAALQALQTTSPHFAIMASIDLARRQMMLDGSKILDKLSRLALESRRELADIPGIRLLGREHALGCRSGFCTLDETKLLIDVSQTGWTGEEAQRYLNREFGVQPELSGPSYLLCILTVGSLRRDVQQLVLGMKRMVQCPSKPAKPLSNVHQLAGEMAARLPPMEMLPRDAFYAPQETIALSAAVGKISGEVITPYPPGIPVLMPGERMTREAIELLQEVRRSGCPISAIDPTMKTVRVVR